MDISKARPDSRDSSRRSPVRPGRHRGHWLACHPVILGYGRALWTLTPARTAWLSVVLLVGLPKLRLGDSAPRTPSSGGDLPGFDQGHRRSYGQARQPGQYREVDGVRKPIHDRSHVVADAQSAVGPGSTGDKAL